MEDEEENDTDDGRRRIVDGEAQPRGEVVLAAEVLGWANGDGAKNKVDHAHCHNGTRNEAVDVIPHKAHCVALLWYQGGRGGRFQY